MAVTATAIRLAAFRELGHLFTFDLAIRKGHKLVTSGPYSYVRHPSYTGLIGAFSGIGLCLLGQGSWARESGVLDTPWGHYAKYLWYVSLVFTPLNFARRTLVEDKMLKTEFQGQWEEWAKNVPYRLLPGVF